MKHFFTFLTVLLFVSQVAGQTTMKIYQNNGTVLQIPLSSIDSITYHIATGSTVSTASITNITDISAESGGDIPNDGGGPVSARGVCWSTVTLPTIADSKTTDGSGIGSFVSHLSGLLPSTTYYVRAYATNNAETTYGIEITFTTSDPPYPVLISDFDGNGFCQGFYSFGFNALATSNSTDNVTDPIPGAYSGIQYWKATGTSNGGYYLEGLGVDGAFNFDINDSIVFYAHNINNPNTRVFVQLIDKKEINGHGETFYWEIHLPANSSWIRYAVGINQLISGDAQPDANDPGMTREYYPSLSAVEKIGFLINTVPATDTIEVNFDDIQIIRVP